MNPLLGRLAALRLRMRLVEGWRGVCALAVLVLGAGLAVGYADYGSHLPSLVRALALVATLGGLTYVGLRWLILPLTRPNDNLSLALRVEATYPELNDLLASTVQFLEQGSAEDSPASDAMRRRAIAQASAQAMQLDFNRVINARGSLILMLAGVVLAATAGITAWLRPGQAQTAVLRLVDPFGPHTWTRVDLPDMPTRVAIGQPYVLRGQIEGIVPTSARVEIDGQTRIEKAVPIQVDAGTGRGQLVMPIDMTQQKGTFRFRVLANDGQYPPTPGRWHDVEVLPPPSLVDLDGKPSPQIDILPPEYAQLPSPMRLAPGARHIHALAGSVVHLRAATDRPLQVAWIEYRPDQLALPTAAALASLGTPDPRAALAQALLGHSVWGRIPVQLSGEGKILEVTFQPWVTGAYVLHLQDTDKLVKDIESTLRVQVDPVPSVKVVRPTGTMTLAPDADLTLRVQVQDETFAVRSVYLEVRRTGVDGNTSSEKAKRIDFYDGPALGEGLPDLLSRIAGLPLTGPPQMFRPKNLELNGIWHLRNQFQEGEVVTLQVCADDFCDIYGRREPGRSHEIQLHIVGKSELAKNFDERLRDVQQQITRLHKEQQDAKQALDELKDKEKITQKDVDRFLEMEQAQRAINEKIGNRGDEGLRGDINQMLQQLKDNKITEGEAKAQAEMLKGALDQLQQRELQQLEPKLAEARKELVSGEKEKSALSRASNLQGKAEQSLAELKKAMDPWSSLQQVKGELRDILQQQNAIKSEVESVTRENQGAPNAEDREKLQRNSKAQLDLAGRLSKTVDQMQAVKENREETKDAESAQKLADAIRTAERAGITNRMREAARNLHGNQPKPQQALQQQEDNVQDLERVIAALEGKKTDTAERLKKKHKENEQEVNKLAKKLKDLERKVQEAKNLPDPGERDKRMKELAKEHEEVREEIEERARELARLREDRAADELNRLADDVERAAEKLRQGQDAAEEQQAAQEHLRQARERMEEFRQELAREELIQIADKLKGIHERQGAAVGRTEEFHRKLTARKNWTDGLADSLGGAAVSQRGLGKEADSLREKLKEAKVFEHILARAAESMEQAAQSMEQRRIDGLENRQYDDAAGESMDAGDLQIEERKQEEILRLQRLAGKRLDNLIDAIKQEIEKPEQVAKNDKEKAEEKKMPEEKKEQDPMPRARAGDGLPPMAELKALKAEQIDINGRTGQFAKQNPDPTRLTPEQQREIDQLQRDQASLQELFQQIIAAQRRGEQP